MSDDKKFIAIIIANINLIISVVFIFIFSKNLLVVPLLSVDFNCVGSMQESFFQQLFHSVAVCFDKTLLI